MQLNDSLNIFLTFNCCHNLYLPFFLHFTGKNFTNLGEKLKISRLFFFSWIFLFRGESKQVQFFVRFGTYLCSRLNYLFTRLKSLAFTQNLYFTFLKFRFCFVTFLHFYSTHLLWYLLSRKKKQKENKTKIASRHNIRLLCCRISKTYKTSERFREASCCLRSLFS